MPKSLTRGPARLLVLAVALGGPLAVVDTANAVPAAAVQLDQAETPEATDVTLVDNGDGDVTVSWTAPDLSGTDAEVTGYVVSLRHDDESRTKSSGDEPLAPTQTSYDFTGVKAGRYGVYVTTYFSDDTQSTAEAQTEDGSPVVAGPAAPEAPTEVEAVATGIPGEARVTWTPAAQPTEDVSGFEVTWVDEDGETRTDYASDSEGEVVVESLAQGSYSFTVVAVDTDDQTSDGATSEALDVDNVSGPSDVEVVQDGPGTLSATWGAPSDAGFDGYELDHYRVVVTPVDEEGQLREESAVESGDLSSSETSYDVSDLGVGEYDVEVAAVYDGGETPVLRSEYSSGEVAAGPEESYSLYATQSYERDDAIDVSWVKGDSRGFAVTGYRITATNPATDMAYTETVGSDEQEGSVTGVPVGSYDVTVTTISEDGESAVSSPTTVDVAESPAMVSGLMVTPNGPGSVRISWQAPASGVAPTSYLVGWARTGLPDGAGADRQEQVTSSVTSFVASGLPAQRHVFYVHAVNGERVGPAVAVESDVAAASTAPAKGAPVVQAKGGALESGEKATIAGTAPKGQVLQLQQREVTSAGARKTADGFTVLGKTKANKKGTYSFKQKFTRNVEVRVVNLTTGAVSPSSFVQVQKDLTLKAKKAGKRTLKLSGKVAPGGAGQVVKVLVKQGAGFVQVGQTTTNKKGAYSFKHTFASKGKAVVQVVSDASSSNTAGSETRTFRVR